MADVIPCLDLVSKVGMHMIDTPTASSRPCALLSWTTIPRPNILNVMSERIVILVQMNPPGFTRYLPISYTTCEVGKSCRPRVTDNHLRLPVFLYT